MLLRRFLHTIHLTSLGLWLGALVMTGVAAATLFPTMRRLDPALPAYSDYQGPHWSLAAGQAAERIFFVNDLIQFVCLLLAGLSFGLLVLVGEAPIRRPATAIRATLLLALVGVLSFHMLVLAPRMNRELRQYWNAAAAGDNATAASHKTTFNADHPTASRLLAANAALVLAALLAGAWSAAAGQTSRAPASARPASDPSPRRPAPTLQEPALLSRKL